MFGKILENVRSTHPLIHNITNYVTVNDVANMILASGASPIMADEEKEAEEITSICNGLNINIGTLQERTIISMMKAGKRAGELGHPIILDPVGAGALKLRTETAVRLLDTLPVTVVRGNMSEIKALSDSTHKTRGVDADVSDTVTDDNLDQAVTYINTVAEKWNCIVAVTGATDLVSDGKKCYVIRNGVKEMSRVTGTGCQLSGLLTAFVSANMECPLEASAAAVCTMGLAGEIALTHMSPYEGNATYRNRIIDAVYNMDSKTLEKGARYELR